MQGLILLPVIFHEFATLFWFDRGWGDQNLNWNQNLNQNWNLILDHSTSRFTKGHI